MRQIKKTLSIFMAALFVMAGFLGNVSAKAATVVVPAINYVGISHSPLVVGDTEKFTVTSAKFEGKVQYRAFLYNGTTWSELTKGYGEAVDAKTPYVLPETPAFKLGAAKLSVWVKRADATGINKNASGDFDSYYVANLNCVNKDDANRVYADGKAKVEVNGLTVKFNGTEDMDGIDGPYLYRLHIYNPKAVTSTNDGWTKRVNEYTEGSSSYTFKEAGTYMVVAHITTKNSPKAWANYEKETDKSDKNQTSTYGTYEAWKTMIVTVPNGIPTAKTTVDAGITAFDRYVEVALDTTTPEDYKVTVLGTELKYVAAKKVFQGLIISTDEVAIKAGVVVVSTKVPTVEIKATTTVDAGITAFDRYVEVALDTTTPENYKVTVLGTELKYVAAKKIFQGLITSTNEVEIKAGVVVSAK